jgi:large subunit ribosomal protein L17
LLKSPRLTAKEIWVQNMRKRIFGRRFKRDTNTRKALFRGLMRSMIIHGRIETTEAKAKSIKGRLEKLVTKALKRGEQSSSELQKYFQTDIVNALVTQVAPKFAGRPGGYTRIIRLGNRKKDDAPMVILEWVEQITVVLAEPTEKRSKKSTEASKEEKKAEVKTTSKKSQAEVKKEAKPTKKKATKKEIVK